jgi:hypothetical protein
MNSKDAEPLGRKSSHNYPRIDKSGEKDGTILRRLEHSLGQREGIKSYTDLGERGRARQRARKYLKLDITFARCLEWDHRLVQQGKGHGCQQRYNSSGPFAATRSNDLALPRRFRETTEANSSHHTCMLAFQEKLLIISQNARLSVLEASYIETVLLH